MRFLCQPPPPPPSIPFFQPCPTVQPVVSPPVVASTPTTPSIQHHSATSPNIPSFQPCPTVQPVVSPPLQSFVSPPVVASTPTTPSIRRHSATVTTAHDVLSADSAPKLIDPDIVIKNYPKLANSSSIGRLAVRLSCEAYFGKEMLLKSTVYGCHNKPPLPKWELQQLKLKLLSIHPQYLSSPLEFEPLWTKCIGTINYCATGLRAKSSSNVKSSSSVITLLL